MEGGTCNKKKVLLGMSISTPPMGKRKRRREKGESNKQEAQKTEGKREKWEGERSLITKRTFWENLCRGE